MPFIHMFDNTFTDRPFVEISIDSLKPEKEWALGATVANLRLVDAPSKSRLSRSKLNDAL